jgi:hypothetical protein
MKKAKLILNHFYSADDLIHGIEVLQHYHVPILEVHLSKPVKGIERKLKIKQLRRGYAAVRFGLLGGTSLSTLLYYLVEQRWAIMNSRSAYAFIISVVVMAFTFFFATCLFPSQAPKVINRVRSDGRSFLIVVDAGSITDHEDVRHLFQYAEAVEMSALVKNIVTT